MLKILFSAALFYATRSYKPHRSRLYVVKHDQNQVIFGVQLQLAFQQIGGPESAALKIEAEVEMLTVANLVFDHARFAVELFPIVMAAQIQYVAGTGHHAVKVAANTGAVDHLNDLAVIVVAVFNQGFDDLSHHEGYKVTIQAIRTTDTTLPHF